MIAHAKNSPVYSVPGHHFGGRGVYTAVPSESGTLTLYHNGSFAFALGDGADEDLFRMAAQIHARGYTAGFRDAKDGIGGAFRTFLLTVGIDPEDTDSRVERLERLEERR